MASLTVILRPASEGDWRSGSALISMSRASRSVILPAARLSRSANELAGGQNADRTQFKRVMKDAGRHKFDVLLFLSLDRLTREGMFRTLCYLRPCGEKREPPSSSRVLRCCGSVTVPIKRFRNTFGLRTKAVSRWKEGDVWWS